MELVLNMVLVSPWRHTAKRCLALPYFFERIVYVWWWSEFQEWLKWKQGVTECCIGRGCVEVVRDWLRAPVDVSPAAYVSTRNRRHYLHLLAVIVRDAITVAKMILLVKAAMTVKVQLPSITDYLSKLVISYTFCFPSATIALVSTCTASRFSYNFTNVWLEKPLKLPSWERNVGAPTELVNTVGFVQRIGFRCRWPLPRRSTSPILCRFCR